MSSRAVPLSQAASSRRSGVAATARSAVLGWLPPHLIVMSLAFFGALGVGYLLLPDDNERIAMLERDGHDRQAIEILEQRFAAGDRNVRTLFQLQQLYEKKGELPLARQMLELLAAARPRDANLQRQQSEFYRTIQDEGAYIASLEARLAQRFSQPICKELIGLYRRAGRYDAEQRTHETCYARGYRRNDDVVRLARLTAADGRMAQAASLLRSVDDRRRLTDDSDRLMLFTALLEAGAADEAKRRAGRWFKGSKDDALVLQIIDNLAADNRHELAIDLAREVGQPGDSVSLAVAELMLDRDQVVAARSYLRGWLDVARLADLELVQRMVRAALDAEDPLLAYRAGELFGLRRLAQDDLVALAEALSAINQKAAFQAVHDVITPGMLRENLLLAAAIEVEKGKPEPARQLLSRVEVKALDEWRLALWTRLMASTGRRATAQQTLRDIAAEASGSNRPALENLAPTAPEPVGRPGLPATEPAPAIVAARTPDLPGTQLSDAANRGRVLRKNREGLAKGGPRRSRLNKPTAPPATKAGTGGLPVSTPFPIGG